jgi:hypothetical protein
LTPVDYRDRPELAALLSRERPGTAAELPHTATALELHAQSLRPGVALDDAPVSVDMIDL